MLIFNNKICVFNFIQFPTIPVINIQFIICQHYDQVRPAIALASLCTKMQLKIILIYMEVLSLTLLNSEEGETILPTDRFIKGMKIYVLLNPFIPNLWFSLFADFPCIN